MEPVQQFDPAPGHTHEAHQVALRRCVLAVSVIDEVDLLPSASGVFLETSAGGVELYWSEISHAIGAADPEHAEARLRLRTWFQLRRAIDERHDLEQRARAIGLPVGHVLHPGPAWVRHRVHGGCLDVGLGFVGLLDDPDEVVVVPQELLFAAKRDARAWWPDQVFALEQTGTLAAARLRRDRTMPLRPFGDFDVITLLASSAFRRELCSGDPIGWRSAAVPMRRRGWLDLGRIDPAFAAAAALATDPVERGFDRAVLVTAEEVVVIASGGRAASHALMDPPASVNPWLRRR